MNKIKYANLGVKSKIKKHFKDNEVDNFEEFMKRLSRKYKIVKPVIKDIEVEFDYLNIILGNNDQRYVITFKSNLSNLLYVRRIDKKQYDVLEIYDNTPFIIKSGLENLKEGIKIEKVYTKEEKENYTYSLNGIPYIMYVFQYKNSYLKTTIKLRFPKRMAFQDNLFMKYMFGFNDIKTIEELYEKIIEFIINKDIYIEISNDINLEFPEKIITKKGELVEYKRNLKTDLEEKYIDYHENMLFITKKENPTTNENLKQIKQMIKK